ncbi:MAG: lasso peptide biosynthesis B2 protein [Proteobacteria bacterium]|nr:lasso peptide biosynthesis B2 protein [Pseudomonadota bacterium]
MAAELVAAGILRESPPEEGASVRNPAYPVSDLSSARASLDSPKRSPHLFLSIATSLTYARRALRSTHISGIVGNVAERKRAQASTEPTEWNRAVQLTGAFLDFRPMFPWDYRCLFDSLALIRFLSLFNLYPDWIFGVQDDPFNAHCWVQAGTRVLNDDIEHVRNYTPIMTV